MIKEINYNEVFDSQRHFRAILDCMARPGKINNIADVDLNVPNQINKASALIGFTLLSSESKFFVVENNEAINGYLTANTLAHPSDINFADFVFLNGNINENELELIKTGQLEYPEDSATVVVDLDQVSDQNMPDSIPIVISGPGVVDLKTLFIKGTSKKILLDLIGLNEEFPLGVDIILTDREGHILCIPRTSHVLIQN